MTAWYKIARSVGEKKVTTESSVKLINTNKHFWRRCQGAVKALERKNKQMHTN
jgi:uncharacterized protein YjiS (DUF1127 family)